MDAAKLRNSCICGNAEPYAACCGVFADPPARIAGLSPLFIEFRHALHELHMHLFPLRMLYQQYWERLGQENYPHHALMEDGDYGRGVVENFFWDYSVQYSDARPILRTAREIENANIRLGHDLLQWSFAPLWPYFVIESGKEEAHLRQVGHGKVWHVWHDGRIPEPGHGVWLRILPYRGEHFTGMARLGTPEPVDPGHFEALAASAFRELKIKPTVHLRPDVHCDEWRRHGGLFLSHWRQMNYDAVVGRPGRTLSAAPVLELPLPQTENWEGRFGEHGSVYPLSEGRYEIRHRHLPLARLEKRDRKFLLSLFDPVFAGAVNRILASLGVDTRSFDPDRVGLSGMDEESGLDAWLHLPHAELGGQTPIQASTHDLGRRRLRILMKEWSMQGRDLRSLKRQMDL